MKISRRHFFKGAIASSTALGIDWLAPNLFQRQLLAAEPEGKKKLVFIFQRGGNDGINTVIPRGDSEYNLTNRPNIFIPENLAIDLGNNFAQLHPRMQPMMEIYNHSSLNGVDGPGNLAVIHRVGYPNQSQSHFDGQQYWENGLPGRPDFEEGMLYRQVAESLHPELNHLAAAAISSSRMVALKGAIPIPTISTLDSFHFAGTPASANKFLGQSPLPPGTGSGLLGLFGDTHDFPGKKYRSLVYGTGQTLAGSMDIVQQALAQGPYTPENNAQYPEDSFGEKLQQIALLLKRTPAQILGCNLGGWDTHVSQGTVNGSHGNLLESVALGFQALYRDLQDQWEDLILVTMTEFGRTSRENGSMGTDHAYACAVFVAGGSVRGGVYNCSPTTWAPGDLFSERDRYVRRNTDYRTIFAELFTRHFQDDWPTLNRVIPNFDLAAAENPDEFKMLGFLPEPTQPQSSSIQLY